MRTTRRLGTAVLALALYAGSAACGGDDDPSDSTPQVSQSPSASAPSSTASTAAPSPGGTPTGRPTPPAGLPAGFPTAKVPVLSGVVTAKEGPASTGGPQGWILELTARGTQDSCFSAAKAALLADGFTQQGEDLIAGDTRQAQFTSPDYAVIISARSEEDGICQVGYEVGQVST
jgi:hypothetical protein